MELSKNYIPNEVEAKWYEHWLTNGYFKSQPDDREPYTVVIPPPNVTGVLHMGHCLNNTGNIRRRYYNCIRLSIIGLAFEIAFDQPMFIPFGFNLIRDIIFTQFHSLQDPINEWVTTFLGF